MYICPKCGKTFDTPTNFCPLCGANMAEQTPVQPVVEQPVVEQPVVEQPVVEQPVYVQPTTPQAPTYAPPAYTQPVNTQPVNPQPQYTQPVYPQNAYQPVQPPSKAKSIVGMVLGISGLAFAAIGLLYTLIFMAVDGAAGFAFGLVFSLISFPLSLVGLIMAKKNISAGDTSAFGKVGKITGLIGVILSGVTLFLAIISLASYEPSSYDYYDDYYYY